MTQVGRVLDILEEQELYIKGCKCNFGQQEVQYLGHIMSPTGVGVDPEKVEAMQRWPKPKNIKSVGGS